MLCIAIAGTEDRKLRQLQLAVEDWCKQTKTEAVIRTFENREALCGDCISDGSIPDILLADMEKNEKIITDTVKKLQSELKECQIIFAGNQVLQQFASSKAERFRYILKSKFPEALEEALKASVEELNDKEEYFEYFFQKKKNVVFCKDILYFESKRRIVEIHVEGEKEPQYFYGRLSGIEKMLEKRKFVRCHQSFIVNTKYIEGFEKNNILLKNSKVTIPISERYEKIVNKKVLWSVR